MDPTGRVDCHGVRAANTEVEPGEPARAVRVAQAGKSSLLCRGVKAARAVVTR